MRVIGRLSGKYIGFRTTQEKSKACPLNYRGIHLTSQLSKVVERILGELCMKYSETSNAFGHNQFAYRKNKGYRDAIAFNVCFWIMAFNKKMQIALYCSDVSGAFDRVCKKRLVKKLRNAGLHPQLLQVFFLYKPRNDNNDPCSSIKLL